MKSVVLGRTGLSVSQLALGGLFAMMEKDRDQARRVVERAVELGITYVDTAPGYGNSEEVLGYALKNIKTPLVLSTKVGGRPQPFDPRNKQGLIESVETSLRLLGREHIDVLLIHEPDRPRQYDWWSDWHQPDGPVLEVIDQLKRRGLIRFAGLGGTTVSEMGYLCSSGRFEVVLTAFNYSLLWREAITGVLPHASKRGMGVVVGSPLQQGALARCFDEAINDPRVYWLSQPRKEQYRQLYRLVAESGIPLPEMGIRFVVSNPDVHCVLMGARTVAEVEQNVAAIEKGPLPADLLAKLDAIAAQVPYRPFGEPFGLGWYLPNALQYRGMGTA